MRCLRPVAFVALFLPVCLPAFGQVPEAPAAPSAAAAPACAAEPLFDLGRVEGMDRYSGPHEGTALLAARGWLVSPETHRQIFDFYYANDLPYFITTDSALHLWRVILEEGMQGFEGRQHSVLASFQARAWTLLTEGRENEQVVGRVEWPEAAQLRAATMVAVGRRLLTPTWAPRTEAGQALLARVAADVDAELARIAAGQPAVSPLFGNTTVDYSLFAPRGALGAVPRLAPFFRARQFWATPLNLDDDGALRTAVALGILCDDHGYSNALTGPYQGLLGPDNLPSVVEMMRTLQLLDNGTTALMREQSASRRLLEGRGLDEARGRLRTGLRQPLVPIGADLRQVLTEAGADGAARPLRVAVWPQQSLPDAAMMARCVWPHVPAPRFPSGLDVMACCGNDRALQVLLAEADEANRVALEAAVRDVRRKRHRLLSRFETREDRRPRDRWAEPLDDGEVSGGVQWLDAEYGAVWAGLEPVFAALAEPGLTASHPRFMATASYADKSLNTSLAFWAGYRHTFALHAPPMAGYFGAAGLTASGYVEPNVPFWVALDDLAQRTDVWLRSHGQDSAKMPQLVELCKRARTIAEKQLAGRPVSPEDNQWMTGYGKRAAALCGYEILLTEDRDESGTVVDLATDCLLEDVLYVGAGRPRAIYVIVDYGGRLQLARGGVMSYREFTRPLADGRLTDAGWHEMLGGGAEPAPPPWLGSLGVEFTHEGLVAAIGEGRVSPEAINRHASGDIARALLEACVARSPDTDNPQWPARRLAAHLGRLLERHGEIADLPLVEGYVAWAEAYGCRIEALPRRAEFVEYYIGLATRWSKEPEKQELWQSVGRALARTDAPAARAWLKEAMAEPGDRPRGLSEALARLGRDGLPEAALEVLTDYLVADLDQLAAAAPGDTRSQVNLHNVRSRLECLWPYWSIPREKWLCGVQGQWQRTPVPPMAYPEHQAALRVRVVAGLKRLADRTADNESHWGFEDLEHLAFCLGPEILETALAERVRKNPLASLYAGIPEEPVKRLLRKP